MKSSGWGKRAWGAVIGGLALAVFALEPQARRFRRPCSGRPPGAADLLLKLDEPSTVRVFRQNRDQGLPRGKGRGEGSEVGHHRAQSR